MTEERNRVFAGERVSRASIEAARGGDLERAIESCDYDLAASIVFARAKAGDAPTVEQISRVLAHIELPSLACALVAICPDRARLLDAIEQRRFPRTKDGHEVETIALYAAWRAGAPMARVIAPLRRLSARPLTAEAYALLATIAAATDDANVAAATKPIASFAKEYAKQIAADDKAMAAPLDASLASLPAEVATSLGGFTVRSAKQVGRNDPCSCGSGLKFKKCCADKPQAAPSPIPGVAWDAFLGSAADQMQPEHVNDLALSDLARVDLARLTRQSRIVALRRFITAHEWDHADRVVGGDDDLRDELVHFLLDAHEVDRARAHIAKLPPDMAADFATELVIYERDPAKSWHALVAAARVVAEATDHVKSIDLAYTLLRAEPVLGILAARASIGAWHVDAPDILLEVVEEVRDDLNLPPSDPAWDVVDTITEQQHKQKPDDAAITSALGASSARIDQLERTLATMKAELDSVRTRPAAELMRAPEQATGLETKVRALEALIREGNAERRDLRKQLESVKPDDDDRREGPRRRAVVEENDDDVGDAVELGSRSISIPRFERRALDALHDVPATVASETMRTLGTLAAGDGFAWRNVKQAKDMTRPVLMARIGIHHRLIFRVEDGMLDVLDLITREQLLTTLKRLRATR